MLHNILRLLLLLLLMLSQDALVLLRRPLRVKVQVVLLERLHVLPAPNVLRATSCAVMRQECLAVVTKIFRHG